MGNWRPNEAEGNCREGSPALQNREPNHSAVSVKYRRRVLDGYLAGVPSEDVPKSEMIRQRRVSVWDVPKRGGSHTGMSVPFWDVPGKSNPIRSMSMVHLTDLPVSHCVGINSPYKVNCCSMHEKTCFPLFVVDGRLAY